MRLDNPAARLLAILEKGLEHKNEANCREVWCHLLQVKRTDHATLMGRIGKVMALSIDIVESLNTIGDIKVERYLHWVKPIENAFIKNDLNGQWGGFRGQINDHVINYLSMTSDLLSHKRSEPVLPKSSLDSILSSARELIDEVRDSDIPAQVKEFMIKQLYRVCLAVEEYSISGSESVSSAVESAFGYGVLHAEAVELAKTNSTARKFWQSMANIALIVSISTGVQQLAPPIMKLLPEINFGEAATEAGEALNMSRQQDADKTGASA